MQRRLLSLGLLAALSAAPAFAQSGPGTPSSDEIRRALTRGIVVPPADSQPQQTQPGQPPANPEPRAAAPSIDLTVTFATGSAAITPAGARVLAELGTALAAPDLAAYRFRIEGHTDTVGDARLNQALSERRATAVATWLTARYAIQPARLMAVGLGETEPAVPTPDNTPEPRNRRVRVVNLGS